MFHCMFQLLEAFPLFSSFLAINCFWNEYWNNNNLIQLLLHQICSSHFWWGKAKGLSRIATSSVIKIQALVLYLLRLHGGNKEDFLGFFPSSSLQAHVVINSHFTITYLDLCWGGCFVFCFRDYPCWWQQEGSSDWADPERAAHRSDLRTEPSRAALPHGCPGWEGDRVL